MRQWCQPTWERLDLDFLKKSKSCVWISLRRSAPEGGTHTNSRARKSHTNQNVWFIRAVRNITRSFRLTSVSLPIVKVDEKLNHNHRTVFGLLRNSQNQVTGTFSSYRQITWETGDCFMNRVRTESFRSMECLKEPGKPAWAIYPIER